MLKRVNSAKKTPVEQDRQHLPINEAMDLAKRYGVNPILYKGGKRYRLLTVDPSSIDANNIPSYLQRRLKTLNK